MLKKILLGCGVLIGAVVVVTILGLVYIGTMTPGTAVQPGEKVRKSFVAEMRELGVLEPDEELRYFYSDGLLSLREGCYVLTDRALVVFVEEEIDPPMRLLFDQILRIECTYSDEFLYDSSVFVHYADEESEDEELASWVYVPLSTERGGDRRFLEALSASTGVEVESVDEGEAWWEEE
ncbi:MAG: hypothetical protein H6831_16200 [Planctomycetes bacterium]|nr:hypothetical protein [Planctomycetota bacterium]MCB9905942.1 hypothetical protein [Planctomycetota bacterium]